MIRMLGIVALLSGLAYLVTPLTAAGPQGDPTAFTTNLRYASPAIGLGAMLLGVDAGLLKPRVQPWLLGALVVLLLVQAVPGLGSRTGTCGRATSCSARSALAIFLILVPVGLVLARAAWRLACHRRRWGGGGARPVVAIGWPKSDDYVKDRYQASTAPQRLPRRHEGRARLVQPREPARLPHRRRRRPARLQAIRLLRRRPLQPRPVRRPPWSARRLPADRERGRAEASRTRASCTSAEEWLRRSTTATTGTP